VHIVDMFFCPGRGPCGFLMVVVLQNTQYSCGRFVDLANTQAQEDRGEGASVVPCQLVRRPMEGA